MSLWNRITKKGGVSAEPAAKPLKHGEQGVEALNDRLEKAYLSPFVAKVEFFPASIKGEGTYAITTGLDFAQDSLTKAGFSKEATEAFPVSVVSKWVVPPEIMEKVVPGAAQASPEELTAKIRQIKGHEFSMVRELPASGENFIIEGVKSDTSRATFLGEGGNKNDIKMYHSMQKRIFISERELNKALGIEEGQRRS
jgi:hypothetical protein